VRRLVAGAQCVIGATTYAHNPLLTEEAIAAGSHFCDLGGNVDVVAAQHRLGARAKKAGVTVIPDCGLAPGMANILAYHWASAFDRVESLQIRVGGLPAKPTGPLQYQLLFSVEGLINEYIEPCEVVVNGKRTTVPGLSGVEPLRFPAPLGRLEAFHTSGGSSTLPRTMAGKVKNLDYKTIRYPGHAEKIRLLHDLGLFSSEPLQLGEGIVRPRRVTGRLLQAHLPDSGPDLALIRIRIRGRRKGRIKGVRYDCIDRFDKRSGLSAMQRTTGFPVAIIAAMLAGGEVAAKGTVPQELAIDGERFLAALTRRGIVFHERRW